MFKNAQQERAPPPVCVSYRSRASEGNEKAQAELTEAVEGKKSVHAACVDAGLRENDPD